MDTSPLHIDAYTISQNRENNNKKIPPGSFTELTKKEKPIWLKNRKETVAIL
jgi:hypothetical protein